MVFKPFGTLARQSIAKLSNGYAQSAVAAAQSSYASSTTFPLARLGHQHGPSKPYSTSRHQQNRGRSENSISQRIHETLSIHHAVRTSDYEDDGKWRQFQYPKRILWTPATPLEQHQQNESELAIIHDRPRSQSMCSIREFSTSSIKQQEVQQVQQEQQEQSTSAILDEDVVIEETQTATTKSAAPTEDVVVLGVEESAQQQNTQDASVQQSTTQTEDVYASAISARNVVQQDDTIHAVPSPPEQPSSGSVSTSPVDKYIQTFETYKNKKDFRGLISEFHHMTNSGIEPNIFAYDYLLHAITQFHTSDRIPQLMSVYEKMVEAKVGLSDYTYSLLVYALVDWTLQAQKLAKQTTDNTHRFRISYPKFESELVYHKKQDYFGKAMGLINQAVAEGKTNMKDMTWDLTVKAAADANQLEDVLLCLDIMENKGKTPSVTPMAAMIKLFGRSKDINSAVECFTSTRDMLLKSRSSLTLSVFSSKVAVLNQAMLYAYFVAGSRTAGFEFVEKLKESMDDWQVPNLMVMLVETFTDVGEYQTALKWTSTLSFNTQAHKAINHLCVSAADANNLQAAEHTYTHLMKRQINIAPAAAEAVVSMLLRNDNYEKLSTFMLASETIEAFSHESLPIFAESFAEHSTSMEMLDENVEMFLKFLDRKAVLQGPRPELDTALNTFSLRLADRNLLTQVQSLRIMKLYDAKRFALNVETAQLLLTAFDGVPLKSLSIADFYTMILPQSIVATAPDASPEAREKLETMFSIAQEYQLPLWNFPTEMVENYQPRQHQNFDLDIKFWNQRVPDALAIEEHIMDNNFIADARTNAGDYIHHWSFPNHNQLPVLDVNQVYPEVDPYEASVDANGASALSAYLDQRNASTRKKMLIKAPALEVIVSAFKLSKGHFPATVVARAIGAIARTSDSTAKRRFEIAYKIFQDALASMPFIPDNRKSRYAWYLMYDSMIAAALNLERPQIATKLHQEMLAFGASPSANTYGLYIVKLKATTETFDEATEALAIFERAKAEGVMPTSFLYNALIGKLAKARRIDDCLYYFSEMRALAIRPTSVTYGTVINALCRVSDERFAEDLFDEMESMENYKPRAAPYNSMIQYFVHSKRDRKKALDYYQRMRDGGIGSSPYTNKLLIEAYATCEPIDMRAAENIVRGMQKDNSLRVYGMHIAALIHAKGCIANDLEGARQEFKNYDPLPGDESMPAAYQAMCEALVHNNQVAEAAKFIEDMEKHSIQMTPYIANALITGYSNEGQIDKCEAVFEQLVHPLTGNRREPSTYEAMVRAYINQRDHESAVKVANEMTSRGYPAPVMTRVIDALRCGGLYNAQLVQ